MERSWRLDELEQMSLDNLKTILRNSDQSTTGYKQKLISRILGEIPPKSSRNSTKKTTSISLRSESPNLLDLPYDVLLLSFLNLTYPQIIAKCRTSQKFNKICNDEKFWKQYAEKHHIKKENSTDTWRETIKYNGKMSRLVNLEDRQVLSEINWRIYENPSNRLRYSVDDKTIPIPQDEYNKIVFKRSIKVLIPKLVKIQNSQVSTKNSQVSTKILRDYGLFKKGNDVRVDETWTPDNSNVIEVIPDTNYGITLERLFDSLYRGIWGLPKNESRPLEELVKYPRLIVGHPYFEGLYIYENPYIVWPSGLGKIYKINAGS